MNNEELKSNLLSPARWIRLAYMVLFAIILYVVSFIMALVVVLQFVISLITGKNNLQLRRFGYSLSTYIYQTLQFLTYNSEEKPFPFADWPDAPDIVEVEVEVEVASTVIVPAEVIVEQEPEAEPKKPKAKKPAKPADTATDVGDAGTEPGVKGPEA